MVKYGIALRRFKAPIQTILDSVVKICRKVPAGLGHGKKILSKMSLVFYFSLWKKCKGIS